MFVHFKKIDHTPRMTAIFGVWSTNELYSLTATMSSVGGLILSAIAVAWMPEDFGRLMVF